jgi:hypothetical protein
MLSTTFASLTGVDADGPVGTTALGAVGFFFAIFFAAAFGSLGDVTTTAGSSLVFAGASSAET